ncbi:MAG: hypothetical protein ACPLRM_01385, partial [Anaerolineae bacterium]
LGYLRDLLILKTCPGRFELLRLSPASHPVLQRQADLVVPERLWQAITVLGELEGQLRLTTQPEVLVELALLEIASGNLVADRLARLEERVRRLEEAIARPTSSDVSEKYGSSALAEVGFERKANAPRESKEPVSLQEEPAKLEPVEKLTWWPRLMETARRKPRIRALLGGVKVASLGDGRMRLGFSARFFKEELEQPSTRATVEELASKLFRRAINLECLLLSEEQITDNEGKNRGDERKVLEQALRLFGGSVLEKEDD